MFRTYCVFIMFLKKFHCKHCTSCIFVPFAMTTIFQQYYHLANIFCPYAANKVDISDSLSFIYVLYILWLFMFKRERNVLPRYELLYKVFCLYSYTLHTCSSYHHTPHIFILKSSWRCTLSSWPHCWVLQSCQRTAPCLSAALNCVFLHQCGLFQTPQS